MYGAFGIVKSSKKNIYVEGLQDNRPIGAFSFLGRYRIIDFMMSNLSNSDIERIQVHVGNRPRSLVEHIGTGRHYNINSKSGKIQMLFSDEKAKGNYDTDIAAYLYNMDNIEHMHCPYVVIVPSYMIYTMDYSKLIETHVESGADITMVYHNVDNADEKYINCSCVTLNKQKGVESVQTNRGTAKSRSIFMDTYVMSTELFLEMVRKAKSISSMYTLLDVVNMSCKVLDIRGVAHHGYFAAITDFKSYYDANMSLINLKTAQTLFTEDWPIYTKTNDSAPTKYFETADVKQSLIANDCKIAGTVVNSIIERGCVIEEGAVVENSVILAGSTIGRDVHVVNQVVDKAAKLIHQKEIISPDGNPGYVRKGDIL